MSVLYVASDQPGAGKTSLCSAFALLLRRQGQRVAVFKPFADSGSDPDATAYRDLLDQDTDGWPISFGSELFSDSVAQASGALSVVSGQADHVIVEAAGAMSAQDTTKLADAFDAKVVVVAGYRPALTASDLSPWTDSLNGRLSGVIVNGVSRYAGHSVTEDLVPSLAEAGMTHLGSIPEDRTLLGASVGQLAAHLGGRFVVDDPDTSMLVERCQVGGMGLDPSKLRFGAETDNAIIVRGDRPDIQMSALSVPVTCLVLTNGIDPIEYVKYEAERVNVPVMVVDSDTIATMDALAGLVEGASFDHPRKLVRFADLVEQHVDLAAITAALDGDGQSKRLS